MRFRRRRLPFSLRGVRLGPPATMGSNDPRSRSGLRAKAGRRVKVDHISLLDGSRRGARGFAGRGSLSFKPQQELLVRELSGPPGFRH